MTPVIGKAGSCSWNLPVTPYLGSLLICSLRATKGLKEVRERRRRELRTFPPSLDPLPSPHSPPTRIAVRTGAQLSSRAVLTCPYASFQRLSCLETRCETVPNIFPISSIRCSLSNPPAVHWRRKPYNDGATDGEHTRRSGTTANPSPHSSSSHPLPTTPQLVLVRHGESEWNKLNLFTGWSVSSSSPRSPTLTQNTNDRKDPALTEKGRAEALAGAQALKSKGYDHFDVAYTSVLTRANHTLAIILKEIGQEDLKTIKDQALNERDCAFYSV